MDNKNMGNWEHELKNKLGDHKEATDSRDLDTFMDKLDNNDFFEPKGNNMSGVLAFLGGVLIAGAAIWMLNGENSNDLEPEISPVIETQTIKTPIIISKDMETVLEGADSVGVKETSMDEDTIPAEEYLVEEKIEETQKVKHDAKDKKDVGPISNSDNSEDEPKVLPALRKRIVIISTDTTVVADTTHVKHRTREKRKK
jgi:hypothetical protein